MEGQREKDRGRKKNGKVMMTGAALFNWSETQRMIEISMEMYQRGYQIVFLGEGKYDFLLQDKPFIREKLCADQMWYHKERIEKMLDMDHVGSEYAKMQEIEKVVAEEISLIKRYQPAVILTGYRMTLSVSARIMKVKIVWCLSAVLSAPYFEKNMERFQDFEENRKRKKESRLLFPEARALCEDALAYAKMVQECTTVKEWNDCLERYGAKHFRCNIEIYRGDLNLMSDARELFSQIKERQGEYEFIGPIFNSQKIEMPLEVREIQNNPERKRKKKILISLGSAGRKEVFCQVLEAMRKFDFEFFISVIGMLSREEMVDYPENFHFYEKFPLIEIAQICDAAIIQGGQGTLYAVAAGRCPFLAFPTTYEQRHNTENMIRFRKCGKILYSYERKIKQIEEAFSELIENPEYQREIELIHQIIEGYLCDSKRRAEKRAADAIEKLIAQRADVSGRINEEKSIID